MSRKPNILIFMTDHQRRETLPGFGWARMPRMEEFAQEAVTFTDAVCPSPHCCPSRASFFSGLYPSDHGVWNNVDVGNALSRGLAKGIRLWSEDLAESGYQMYYSGKWHVSAEEGPQDRGFELLYHTKSYTGIKSGDEMRVPVTYEWNWYMDRPMCDPARERRDGEIMRNGYPEYFLYGENEHPFGDEDVVNAAVNKLREGGDGENPWCMFVGPLGPHDPYFVPQRFLDMYDIDEIELPANCRDNLLDKPALYRRTQKPYSQLTDREQKEALRHYLAFCTYEDYLFGQVMDALREGGDYENTAVIYLSDHGDYAGAHGLWAKGLPCFREAYAIPLMIKLPGGRRGVRVDDPVALTDLAPTILDMADVHPERRFAGVSLKGYLTDGPRPEKRKYRFTQTNGNELYGIQRSIFSDEWKYVYNGFDFDELYDLKNDPDELCNLAEDPRYAEVIRELSTELWKFAYENHDVNINPYIMVGLAPYGPGVYISKSGEKR